MPEAVEQTVILADEGLRRLQGFTQIPNVVLTHSKLKSDAKIVYGVLLSYAWQKDFCYPAQDRIARDMNCSVRTVQRHLSELERNGLIDVRRRGLNKPNIYKILPITGWKKATAAREDMDTTRLSSPETTRSSSQDATSLTHKEYTSNNIQRNNVNVIQRPQSRTQNTANPSVQRAALANAYNLDDRGTGRVEYLVDRQVHFLGRSNEQGRDNQPGYIKRAAEAVRDGLDGRLEMALRDFDEAAKVMKDPPRIRPAYFHAVWKALVEAVQASEEQGATTPQKPTLRVNKPGLQHLFDGVWDGQTS